MKRGAEKDLHKDNADEDEDEEVPDEGFRKASDTVLASRPMRGLPKRSFTSPAPQNAAPVPDTSPTPVPKFGGFSGFGTPSTNSFSFSAPPAATSPFNTTTSQFSILKPEPSTQTVAPTASNTAKTFASFLSQPSSKPEPTPSQPPQQTAPLPSSKAPDVDDPTLFKYYTSLRGLNASLLDALSKATEEDPFADISDLLDRYKSLRLDVQKEFDEKSKTSSEPPAAPKLTSMPAPPTKFTGFPQPSTSTSKISENSAGGWKPQPTSASSTSLSGPSFTSTLTPASTSGFSFAAPPATQASTSTSPFVLKPSSGFASSSGGSTSNGSSLFGTAEHTIPSSSSFTFAASPAPDTSTEKNKSSANTSGFGASSMPGASNSAFRTTENTASASFTFGTPPASNTGTSAFGNGTSSSTTIYNPSFSTPSPAKSGSFGGFGGFGSRPAGGSIGNPVGFGFGSPPKTSAVEVATTGITSSDDADNKDDVETTITESQEGQAKADGEATFGMSTKYQHDEEGEGEENEETMHAVKLKAFRLRKPDEKEGSNWLELGYGVLRLKKHKETELRRILLRNSSTGKININFNIYSGLKPTLSKKALTFVGHDEAGTSQTYSVRLQSEEQAKLLKEAFDREIAFVKARSYG